jgi:tRNA/rRNA methyltransferase
MERVLLEAGFLNPQAPEHVLRELLHTLRRAALSQREAELWTSAFKHLERASAAAKEK